LPVSSSERTSSRSSGSSTAGAWIAGGARPGIVECRQLGRHVAGPLAPGCAAGVARLLHLPDLQLALGAAGTPAVPGEPSGGC
jgi:hypothetical protein